MEKGDGSFHGSALCPVPEDYNPFGVSTKMDSQKLLEQLEQFCVKEEEIHLKEEPQEWLISDVKSLVESLPTQPSTDFLGSTSCVAKIEKDLKEDPDTQPVMGYVYSAAVDIQKTIKEEIDDEYSTVSKNFGSWEDQVQKKESDCWSESEDIKPVKEEVEENSICQTDDREEPETPRKKTKCRRRRYLSSKKRFPRPGPEQVFKCETCDKVIKHIHNFREHQRIHTGERPYKCKVCKKNFTRCADLIKHRLVHSNRRPHKCKTCGKKFKLAGDLRKHSKVHSDLFPFKCESCEKCFKRTSCLIKHMRIHTEEKPFPCSVCGKRFKWEASVREHQRIHSGEKPFKCPDCGKSFTHFSTFMQHKRTHREDAAFRCDICKKSFNHKSNLLKHRRTIHM
ncbi:uncharacterized protein O3C94_000013 [Discoglossus pictus]